MDAIRTGAAFLVSLSVVAGGPAAAQSVESFYTGKQIEFVIGIPPGATYDIWARLIARHMGKHIPGNPTFLPRNMPGAAGMVALNHLYTQAPRDGSVVAIVGRNMPLQEAMGNSAVMFKSTELGFLGSPETIYRLCISSAGAKVKTSADLFKEELVVGGTTGGGNAATPTLLGKLLGMKFKLVTGYTDPQEVFLAMERGEVDGQCTSLSGIEASRPGWLAQGKLNALLSIEEKPVTGLAGVKIPTTYDFATTDEQRQILDLFGASSMLGWPIATTPGVPKDYLEALRRAFAVTMQDKEFLANAATLGFNINPTSGEELHQIVAKLIRTPKAIIDKTTEIVGNLQ